MSVLVKGMAMPKDCRVCPFAENVPPGRTRCLITCIMLSDNYCPTPLDWRHERCPLVKVKTPHGNLVDAEDVKRRMIPLSFSVQKWIGEVELSNCKIVIKAEDGT